MYADAAGCLKKRRGWRRLASVAAPVRGIYSYRGIFVVHGGGCLYTWCGGTDTPQLIYSGLGGEKSRALSHGGNLYIMTGAEYMRIGPARREGVVYGYDHSADRALKTVVEVEDERVTVKKYRYNTSNLVRDFELTGTENLTQSLVAEPVREVGYAPITHMNCRMETSANPNSSLISFSGEEYEPSNMAVRCRRNNFTLDTDGTAAVYPVVDSMIAHDAVLSDLELVTAAGNVIENVLFFCDSGEKS